MRNKIAFRVALGGICSAVCLLLMFSSSFLPMLDYTIPTFAGFMMVVMIVEVDKNWAIATYCAVSLLSIFVTPNYEATLLFILFMGYYPILKYYLDQKKNRLLVWAIKLACSVQCGDSHILFGFSVYLYFGGYARGHGDVWQVCRACSVGGGEPVFLYL